MSQVLRTTVSAAEVTLPDQSWLQKLPVVAGALGGGALVGAFLLRGADVRQFFFSYLWAFLFFVSISLGALFFVLLQHAVRAGWSVAVRRIAENLMGALPLFLVLFIPVVLGLHELYHWSHPGAATGDPILTHKLGYLNAPFFKIRAFGYLIVWLLLARYFRNSSVAQDATGDHQITRRLQFWCYPALILFAVTVTFSAFDWIMSLDPHWYSTIFGAYYFAGGVVAGLATMVVLYALLRRQIMLEGIVTPDHLQDVGKLLFAFTMFWTYMAVSQYLLIWYADLPEETAWFGKRMVGSWNSVSVLLAVGHFVVPFFFLMPRAAKRNILPLLLGALWMLFIHAVDLYWLVMPTLHPEGARLTSQDALCFLAVGGMVAGYVGYLVKKNALVPVRDPRLPESLAFENV